MARTKNQRLIKRRINSKRTRRIRKRIRKNSKRRGIKKGRTRKFKGGYGDEEIKKQIEESKDKYIEIMEEFGRINQELDKGNEALRQQFVNYKEIFDYLKDLLTMAYFKPEFETQLQSAKEIENKLEKSREVNRILQDLQREWNKYQNQIKIQGRGEKPDTIVTPSNLESRDTRVPYVPPAETYTVSISLTNTEDCQQKKNNKFCKEQKEKTIGNMRVKLTKPQKISQLNITRTTSPAIISFTFDSKHKKEYEQFVRYVDDLLYSVFKDIIYKLFINEDEVDQAKIDQAKVDDLSLIPRGTVTNLTGRFGSPKAEAEPRQEQKDREFFSSEIENEILINDICMELFGEALDQETQNDIKKIQGILKFVDKDINNPRPKPSSVKKSENMRGGGDFLKGLFSFGKGCLQGCGVLFGFGVGASLGLAAFCAAFGLGGAVGGVGFNWGLVGAVVAIVGGLISIILGSVFSLGKGTSAESQAVGEKIDGSGEIFFSGIGLGGKVFNFFWSGIAGSYDIGKGIVNFSLGE